MLIVAEFPLKNEHVDPLRTMKMNTMDSNLHSVLVLLFLSHERSNVGVKTDGRVPHGYGIPQPAALGWL